MASVENLPSPSASPAGRGTRVAVFAVEQSSVDGMARALAAADYQVVARVTDDKELQSECVAQSPDAVAIGFFEPEKALQRLCRRLRGNRIVVVGPSADRISLSSLLESGVEAFVLESALDETLALAVGSVCAGQYCFPAKLGHGLEGPFLSPREKQVLGMVVMGLSNADIAQKLWLAEATVKSHLGSIFRKLGVRSRNEAAALVLDPSSGLGAGVLTIPRTATSSLGGEPDGSTPDEDRIPLEGSESDETVDAAARAEAESEEPIPLTRMDHHDPALLRTLLDAVEGVATRGAFTLGQEVEDFEREFAAYCEVGHAIGVSSGTEALALSLRALDVGPGDEVIVPANSFIATAEAVTLVGATPRLVDVDPVHQTLTAETVERSVTSRTRCVVAVHLYGRTVELEPIIRVARDLGLAVIEDACQAHGARYKGRRVGTIADCGCFSFYPAKNLGAWGDGGAVVTSRGDVAERVRLLRSHGEQPRYHHQICGTTGRLDAIQAAVLRIKLRHLDEWNVARRRLATDLTKALSGSIIRPPASVPAGHDHVFHQYVVVCEERDALRRHLTERGIASGVHYPVPIHLSEAYASLGMGPRSLPVTERLSRQMLSLPIFPRMSPREVERIAEAILEFDAPDAGGPKPEAAVA